MKRQNKKMRVKKQATLRKTKGSEVKGRAALTWKKWLT